MLLSHAVLAVVYGGLLAAAHPEAGYPRTYADADANEAAHPQVGVRNVPYERAAWDAPHLQRIMDMHLPDVGFGEQLPVEPGRRPDEPPRGPQEPPHFPHPPPGPRPPFPGHPPPEHPDHPPAPPHEPPGAPNWENLTIYQFLERRKDLSRLFKLVNYTEEITSLLNDTSANVTFFALPDWAFPHRPHHGRPKKPHHLADAQQLVQDDLLDALATAEGLVELDEDDDKKDKKKFLKAILKAILKYETLPTALPSSELAKNVTYATSLTLPDGSLDGESLRIRVSSGPGLFSPHVNVNVASRIVHADIKTANGFVHVVNKPVLPPPSIFQIGFLFQDAFSTLTSALQRVGLTDAVEWREVHSSDGKHTVDGSPAVTFFAPTNKAFTRLPRNLKLFLFSPFGERVLKKLLQFHIVPELVLHANYVHNASESDAAQTRRAWEENDVWDMFGNLAYNDDELEPDDVLDSVNDNPAVPPCPFKNRTGKFPGAVRSGEQFAEWPQMPPRNPFAKGPKSGPPPPPPHGDGPHDPWAPHEPPFEHGRFPPPPPAFPQHGHHGPHGPLPPPPPPPPPFEREPHHHHHHHHHGPPPPEIHYHYHYHTPPPPPPPHHGHPSNGPHFPPHFPEHGPHFPEHGPHFPAPPPPSPHHGHPSDGPHFPPHFPEHGPHFPAPPPPPPHHPPFEHGPHFPERGPPFPEHGPHSPEHGPHFPEHGPRFPEHGPHFPEHGPHFPEHGSHPPPPPPPAEPHKLPRPQIVYSRNLTHPTLLANHSLNLHVVQLAHTIPIPGHARTFYQTATFAHGVPVSLSDIPTRNGVLHVVDKLINPRWTPGSHRRGPPKEGEGEEAWVGGFEMDEESEDEWAGWEEWLIRWADEA